MAAPCATVHEYNGAFRRISPCQLHYLLGQFHRGFNEVPLLLGIQPRSQHRVGQIFFAKRYVITRRSG
jgi:hypothetical protein